MSEQKVWETIRTKDTLGLMLEITNLDDLNIQNSDGHTLLVYSILHGNITATELLIDCGADIDLESGSESRDTPLIAAITTNNLPLAGTLLEAGASPTKENSYGDSPLSSASQFNNTCAWNTIFKHINDGKYS